MSKLIKFFFLFLILIGCLAWVYVETQKEDFQFDFNNTFKESNFIYWGISFLFFFLINYLRSSRTYFLIHHLPIKQKKKVFNIILASYPLAFFFTSSGIIFRCIFLKKESQIPLTQTISFFSLEKLMDIFFVGLLIILLSYNVFVQSGFWFDYVSYIYILIFIGLTIIPFLYWRNFFFDFLIKLIHLFSKKIKWKRKIIYLKSSLNKILTLNKTIALTGLTLLIWISEYFFIFFLMQGFSERLNFYSSGIIFTLVQLCIVFPITPTGVGVWETGFILADNILKIKDLNLLVIGIISHLILTIFFIFLLLLSFYFLNLKLPDLIKNLIKKYSDLFKSNSKKI